jgi:hypothetical protein
MKDKYFMFFLIPTIIFAGTLFKNITLICPIFRVAVLLAHISHITFTKTLTSHVICYFVYYSRFINVPASVLRARFHKATIFYCNAKYMHITVTPLCTLNSFSPVTCTTNSMKLSNHVTNRMRTFQDERV